MNIEQAKKQAKNLRRLLPAYMAEHPDAGKLSDVQELIARTHGYPSFHAMVMAQERPAELAPRPQLGSLLVSYKGVSEWEMFDSEGNPKRPVNVAYGELGTSAIAYSDEDILSQVTEEFDEACESEGGMTGDMKDYPASALNRLCRLAKKLTKKEPAFIDGYAFQAGALIIRGQHDEARRLAELLRRKLDPAGHRQPREEADGAEKVAEFAADHPWSDTPADSKLAISLRKATADCTSG